MLSEGTPYPQKLPDLGRMVYSRQKQRFSLSRRRAIHPGKLSSPFYEITTEKYTLLTSSFPPSFLPVRSGNSHDNHTPGSPLAGRYHSEPDKKRKGKDEGEGRDFFEEFDAFFTQKTHFPLFYLWACFNFKLLI